MNKKTIWIIGFVCLIFSTQLFAREDMSLEEIEKLYSSAASTSPSKAKKLLLDMLYKDFFFHKAAEACSVKTAKFFLDKITDTLQIDEYLMKVRRPVGEITVDPYQQAVMSGCLAVVEEIDMKIMNLIGMKLKSRVDPYASCNSNLHLMILSKTESAFQTELNRDMVRYFLSDKLTPFLKNLDDCKPVDVLDLNRELISNYLSIRHELSHGAIVSKPHMQQVAESFTDNCRAGYSAFVAPANK